jgi:CRISP-associated protein Cas1
VRRCQGDAIYNTLFTYKLSQIVIFGNVEIAHRALAQLMRFEIDTVFLTENGRYLGRITSPEARNVFHRKRLCDLLGDRDFGIRMARAIMSGKLANMATILMRIKRTRDDALSGPKAHAIHDLLKPVQEADNLNSIRGYEGR